MKKVLFSTMVVALLIVSGVAAITTAQAPAVKVMSVGINTHPSQGDVVPVDGGEATLISTEDGVTMSFRTSALEDGHVYTAWWVIVNNPAACSATPCPVSEILGSSDLLETEITQADGIIVGDTGEMEFADYLAVGDVDEDEAWFGNGLTNPMGAEIHMVINDHGPLIPDMAANMLNTYRGGCQDEGLPPPFPATAISDGEPGPNTCRLVQAAVFHQTTD
jgi:hypothetical protein